MDKIISVLGSTGSIGTQTLDVAKANHIKVSALVAHKNAKLLEQQAREFSPQIAVLTDEDCAKDLKIKLADTNVKVLCGEEGLLEAACAQNCDTVVNALVGISGLKPTMAAINAHKDLALANKETLVAGGSLVMKAARENKVKIYPVDSEHSAVFQCIQGCPKGAVKRIILTASGGPFFGKTKEELKCATLEQAMRHPNWSMGAKITIDSATMMNKGFEIIEAAWLFDIDIDKIDVVVHRESIVHSMVELKDNAIIAQLGSADMRLPIQYALSYPHRNEAVAKPLDLLSYGKLTFLPPDNEAFPAMQICRKAFEYGGIAPCAVNGANEAAVGAFLSGKIGFSDITKAAGEVLDSIKEIESQVFCGTASHNVNLDTVLKADKISRRFAYSYLKIM